MDIQYYVKLYEGKSIEELRADFQEYSDEISRLRYWLKYTSIKRGRRHRRRRAELKKELAKLKEARPEELKEISEIAKRIDELLVEKHLIVREFDDIQADIQKALDVGDYGLAEHFRRDEKYNKRSMQIVKSKIRRLNSKITSLRDSPTKARRKFIEEEVFPNLDLRIENLESEKRIAVQSLDSYNAIVKVIANEIAKR